MNYSSCPYNFTINLSMFSPLQGFMYRFYLTQVSATKDGVLFYLDLLEEGRH